MKLRVPSLEAFMSECNGKSIKECRMATLFSNVEGRAGKTSIPMLNSKTIVSAALDPGTVLMYERGNGSALNISDERKALGDKSGKTEDSLQKELEGKGITVKEGVFEL